MMATPDFSFDSAKPDGSGTPSASPPPFETFTVTVGATGSFSHPGNGVPQVISAHSQPQSLPPLPSEVALPGPGAACAQALTLTSLDSLGGEEGVPSVWDDSGSSTETASLTEDSPDHSASESEQGPEDPQGFHDAADIAQISQQIAANPELITAVQLRLAEVTEEMRTLTGILQWLSQLNACDPPPGPK
eukprot:RCo038832